MKPTNKQLLEWFEYLWQSKAIYLWGANGEKITPKLTHKLFAWFGSKNYSLEYYSDKLKEGEGKIGADCSGSFYPISGFDATAQGYYNKCSESGSIVKIPRQKVCQVFKYSIVQKKMTHIGLYDGNGYTIEMKSSKDNVHKEKFNPLRWTHYGIPDWIEYVKENPYPEPIETVFKGMKGLAVKWVQWELVQDGFKLSIDGSCGKKTDKAIRDYQKKHNLTIDGRVWTQTITEMNK